MTDEKLLEMAVEMRRYSYVPYSHYAVGAALLGKEQVFCGNLHPAADVLDGKPELFDEKVRNIHTASGGRTIIAAGCDIPPATPEENMIAFREACEHLAK